MTNNVLQGTNRNIYMVLQCWSSCPFCFLIVYSSRDQLKALKLIIFYRQNDGAAAVRPSSAGELPPLERTGSPTGAEKDILVICFYLFRLCCSGVLQGCYSYGCYGRCGGLLWSVH